MGTWLKIANPPPVRVQFLNPLLNNLYSGENMFCKADIIFVMVLIGQRQGTYQKHLHSNDEEEKNSTKQQ